VRIVFQEDMMRITLALLISFAMFFLSGALSAFFIVAFYPAMFGVAIFLIITSLAVTEHLGPWWYANLDGS
jgi:cell division protein FtsW (lipid II flippase)